ncbi:hypothetical protein [Oceaniradius stylonematis]|uniref:hypothetical protein n=1 Tax=Oceaniradius stylonematis TaxID=2184161 RepID=UPI00273EBDAC|nr:hypothetical protein [Oceaniradius stylonematis]
MTNDDAVKDIAAALIALADAFKKHNIPVPDQLSFSDPDDADLAKRELHSAMHPKFATLPNEADEIRGFRLLWR